MKKIVLILVTSFVVTFLYPNLLPGLSGQKEFSLSSQSLAYAEVPKDTTPKMNQTLPAYPIRKPPVLKPVANPSGRRDPVLPPGKTQPPQHSASNSSQASNSKLSRSSNITQPQQTQPQMEQPIQYTDPNVIYQSQDQSPQNIYADQPQQTTAPSQDTTSGNSEGYSGTQTDMQRRTGGQAQG